MKTRILSLVAAMAVLGSVAATAQNANQSNAAATCKKEAACAKAKDCKKARQDWQCAKQEGKCLEDKADRYARALEGITLNEKQKASFDALRAERKAQAEARKVEAREARAQQKMEKVRQKDQAREARNNNQREYLQKVKNILSPEQYVVFLENLVVEQPAAGHAHNSKVAHQHKDHQGKDMKKAGKAAK